MTAPSDEIASATASGSASLARWAIGTSTILYPRCPKMQLRMRLGPQSFDKRPLVNVTGGMSESGALGFDDPVPAAPLIFDVGTPDPATNGCGRVSALTGNGVTTAWIGVKNCCEYTAPTFGWSGGRMAWKSVSSISSTGTVRSALSESPVKMR